MQGEAASNSAGAVWVLEDANKQEGSWAPIDGPITGPTNAGAFMGRAHIGVSQGAKVLVPVSTSPKALWVFQRIKAA